MANKYRFFVAYFDFLFDEPLKHDTYSPYISLIICIITYYPLAIFWAITFENPSIIEETAAIWNYTSFLLLLLPTVLISNHCHSIIYWWISKSNSSKESCFKIEYEAYNKIHMWRISIGFLHILMGSLFFVFFKWRKIILCTNLTRWSGFLCSSA